MRLFNVNARDELLKWLFSELLAHIFVTSVAIPLIVNPCGHPDYSHGLLTQLVVSQQPPSPTTRGVADGRAGFVPTPAPFITRGWGGGIPGNNVLLIRYLIITNGIAHLCISRNLLAENRGEKIGVSGF